MGTAAAMDPRMSRNAPGQVRSRTALASLVAVLVSGSVSAHATPTPSLPATSTGVTTSAAGSDSSVAPVTPAAPEPSEEITPAPEPAHDPFARELSGGRIVSGLASHRALHFTFDDGPSEHTPALLDALDAHGVHATFFLVARQLEHERGRRVAREIMARGHTIGLHSYRHDDLTALDATALRRDLDRSERVYEDVFEARPWLFRPPYGRHSEAVDVELASRGYTEVLWNITTSDGHARSADEVVEGFREALDQQERMSRGAGGVVVFHDTHRWVVEAMPRIFEEIEARNCELADSGEELWDVHDDLGAWHEARGRAAATRSARRMRLDDETLAARQAALRDALECEAADDLELAAR
jgi:peptidoglycan/xylan/chitin deacetylase (PgdA/CDA1 family)